MSDPAFWRIATGADLDAIMSIQAAVHPLQERREVLADKMRLFPEGSWMLDRRGRCLGYGIAHPWRLGTIPALDARLDALPVAADCLFVHDVALLPEARGRGAGGAFIEMATRMARGLPALALVSVYGTVPTWERCGFRVVADLVPAESLARYGDTARYMVNRLDASERAAFGAA